MKVTLLGVFTFLMAITGSSSTYAEVADKDCGEFSSHQEVMEFWYVNGYSAEYDPHRLDGDGDGLACEISQSEYEIFIADNEANASDEQKDVPDKAVEGEELPDTASNNTLIMLLGAGTAAAGSLLLFRRKQREA